MAELEKMFTVDEIADEWFDGKKKRAYEAAYKNHIPSIRIGRSLRFPESAIREWIKNQSVKPKAQNQGESLAATT